MTNTESPRPIENHNGNLVFTGVGIELYRAATIASGLAMKVSRGKNMTRAFPGRSPLQVANAISDQLDWAAITAATGIKAPAGFAAKRTNAGALLDLTIFLMVVFGWEPISSVAAAIDERKLGPARRKAAKVRAALQVIDAAEKAASGS